jgi:hypothetical protein
MLILHRTRAQTTNAFVYISRKFQSIPNFKQIIPILIPIKYKKDEQLNTRKISHFFIFLGPMGPILTLSLILASENTTYSSA